MISLKKKAIDHKVPVFAKTLPICGAKVTISDVCVYDVCVDVGGESGLRCLTYIDQNLKEVFVPIAQLPLAQKFKVQC